MDNSADDSRYATNRQRLSHRNEIDAVFAAEVAARDREELLVLLDAHEVGAAPVNSIAEVMEDPQLRARGAIISVDDLELGPVAMQDVQPRFSGTPGRVHSTGPRMGQDNAEVFGQWLGLGDAELRTLKAEGII
jgi:succinyl-CoA:(S)-malate CoA-transferase subunit A/succinyl-CoA:(S)-malate CoA-transferase subunit B